MANENGAVKRVMFDGGYATFADAGSKEFQSIFPFMIMKKKNGTC